jgi:hypothetical protein
MRSLVPLSVFFALATAPALASDPVEYILGHGTGGRWAEGNRDNCWSEPPDPDGTVGTSEIMIEMDFESELVNDFVLDTANGISDVMWWGFYWHYAPGDPLVDSFNLRFYEDAGGLPGEILAEFIIDHNCDETYVFESSLGTPAYEYHAPVVFGAMADETYWFGAQAGDHHFPPEWGRLETMQVTGYMSAIRCAYLSFPDWTPCDYVFGQAFDASQIFTCAPMVWIRHVHLDPTEEEEISFTVEAEIASYGSELISDAVWMKYKTQWPGFWIPVDMVHIEGDTWKGTIPAQSQPTEIAYYLYAEDMGGNWRYAPEGGSQDPYLFDVGWVAEVFEEGDGGFIVDPDGDDTAETGIWDRVDPDGPPEREPEDDHTGDGTLCWVTADGPVDRYNAAAKTTLQSPAYNLSGASSAKVKYWRWFTARSPQGRWAVDVRNNGGNWIHLELTSDRLPQWVQMVFDLAGTLGEELGMVEFRFIAHESSNLGEPEAALDDFVILADFSSSSISAGPGANPSYALYGATPSPFNPRTMIRFEVPVSCPVTLRVYDVSGQLVRSLLEDEMTSAGRHGVTWDGTSDAGNPVAGGSYYVRFAAGAFQASRPISLLK